MYATLEIRKEMQYESPWSQHAFHGPAFKAHSHNLLCFCPKHSCFSVKELLPLSNKCGKGENSLARGQLPVMDVNPALLMRPGGLPGFYTLETLQIERQLSHGQDMRIEPLIVVGF